MRPAVVLVTGLVLAMVACERALAGRKVQSALAPVLLVYASVGLATVALLTLVDGIPLVPLAIFWAGAFLSWFGVRSHIESSILLGMVRLLRHGPRSASELLAHYEGQYGEQARRDELTRAGLVTAGPEGVTLTRRGRAILRVARALGAGGPAPSAPPGPRGGRVRRAALGGLLLASLALNTVGITWGLPAFESWSNDDLTPLSPLVAAHGRFATPTKYPPVHNAILALVDSPYVGYLYVTGQLRAPAPEFPYGLADPLTALTTLMLLGRVVSALMGVGTVYLVYRATLFLTDHWMAAVLAGSVVAFNAEFVLFSHLGNTDVPALFWLAAALTCFARVAVKWRAFDGALLGVAGALAVATKDTSYAALAGMALVLIGLWARDRRPVLPLAVGLGAFVVSYALASNWLWGWSAYVARMQSLLAAAAQPEIQVPPTLAGQATLARQSLGHLAAGTGWPMLLAMAIGLIVAARRGATLPLALLVPVATHYVGAIAAVRFVFPRYLLPCVLLLAPLTGLALAPRPETRFGRARALLVAVVLGSSLGWAALADTRLLSDVRYEAEDHLRKRVPDGGLVEVYSPPSYLPRLREMGFTVRQIRPQPATDAMFSPGALAARDPDAIVLSSKGSSTLASRHREYLDDLLGGRLGYRVTAFPGLDARRGAHPHDPEAYVSRVSPTIWVLERDRVASGSLAAPRVARPEPGR